jgi:hypothetical protein
MLLNGKGTAQAYYKVAMSVRVCMAQLHTYYSKYICLYKHVHAHAHAHAHAPAHAPAPAPAPAPALFLIQFGMYNEGDWGCTNPPTGKTGAGDSTNTYIRY